jgi:hypothetical protein
LSPHQPPAPPIDPDAAPLLFVCGLHRSGTTVLARVLASSPGARGLTGTGVMADEGQHLQAVLPPASRYGGPGAFAFDGRSHLTEDSPLASPATARALLAAWTPFWHLTGDEVLGWGPAPGRVVLVEKSPPNLVRTRFLQALFPQARFVVVVRHPGVVAISTRRMRPQRRVDDLLRHWSCAHEVVEQDAPHLRHLHVIRYEDLVAHPGPVLDRLAATVGVSPRFDISLLERGRSDPLLRAWAAEPPALSPRTRRLLESRIGRYGYRLEEPYVEHWDGPGEDQPPGSPSVR